MTSQGVTVVIPTWNGQDLLERFLPSVLLATRKFSAEFNAPTEVIVVDDASTDRSLEWLNRLGFSMPGRNIDVEDQLRYQQRQRTVLKAIRNERNQGFGETCNYGVREATHPLVLLLNNDVSVYPDLIAPLVENFSDPLVFAAHCKAFNRRDGTLCGTGKVGDFSFGSFRVHRSWKPRDESATLGQNFISMFAGGGSAMFHKEIFLKIGGFERLLSPYYWEDVELSYRAWKRGYRIVYEPRSIVEHEVSSTIGKLNRRRVRTIEARNKLLYHWIHLHDRRMMVAHVSWLSALALTAPLTLRLDLISGLLGALKLLPEVRKRRAVERSAASRTDREVLQAFRDLEQRPDVSVYDNLRHAADLDRLVASPQE
jgi:GT2 family glycosyltransferase